jgi:hypothetical protein
MDRKELIRQYKTTRRPMGVYRVFNKIDGKSFVGTATNLPAVLNRHKFQLVLRGHPNRDLQKDWDRLGPEAFRFEVLDTLTPPDQEDYDPTSDLRVLEDLWLQKLKPFDDRGYNESSKRTA